MINEHVYPPDIRQLKFVPGGKGQIDEWVSSGKNSNAIRNFSTASHPLVNVNADDFEIKFKGGRLSYGNTSKFNSSVTNVYLVYKLYLFNSPEIAKYPIINSLFGAITVDRKGSTDPEKWFFCGKGIAFDAKGTYSMGAQVLARNVIIFGVDNSSSKHPVNRPHNFMVLGNGNTQLVENVNSIPEQGLVINMSYPGKKFVLSIHYSGGDSTLYANGILMTTFSDVYYGDKKDQIGFSLGQLTKDFGNSSIEELVMGLNGGVYDFSIHHRIMKSEDILNIPHEKT